MKKLLFLFLLFGGMIDSFALTGDTATTNGKWSAATQTTWSLGYKPGPPEMYVHKTGINDTCDIDTTIGGFLTQGTGTWWFPAGRKLHVLNNMFDSSTGTGRPPDSLFFDGATSQYRISSGVGVRTVGVINLIFTGANCLIKSFKAGTLKSLTIGNNAILVDSNGVGWAYNATTGPALTLGNSATYTNNAIAGVRFYLYDLTSSLIFGSNCIFNGAGPIIFNPEVTGLIFPAFSYTGIGTMVIQPQNPDNVSWSLAGNFTANTSLGLTINNNAHVGTIFNSASKTISILAGVLKLGGSTNTSNLYLWSSPIFCASYDGAAAGCDDSRCTIHWGKTPTTCSGSWIYGNATGITDSSAGSSVTFTGVGTTTSNGKTFPGSIIVNAVGTTRTLADKIRVAGNMAVTHGSVLFAVGTRDTIIGDWTNALTGTDSVNYNQDSCWVGGSFTGNLRVKNNLSRHYLFGSALCNMTTNGATLNYFDIRGTDRTKQEKLIDRHHIRKQVVTTGTLNTNGQDFFADSFLVVNDSIATVLGDTISARKMTFGASAKPIIGTPLFLYFGLALADTLWDSCSRSVGEIVIAKTAGSSWSSVGVLRSDDFTAVSGNVTIGAAAGDSAYSVDVVLNNANVTVNSTWIISGVFSCAQATVFTFGPGGKIVLLNCVAGTTNANATVKLYYPTISPIAYPNSSTWSDTVGKAHAHALTISGCSLGKDSVVLIGAWPAGYSINTSTGLVSWSGVGAVVAGSYVVRAYGNAKTDSASVTVSVTVGAAQATSRRLPGSLGLWLGIGR